MNKDFDLIKDIKSPADIKAMSIPQLEEVADRMRDAVLFRCSSIGGHVSPNLGDVESIIAMHYVFSAPHDRIVLDVSHQDFPHKMLTGRVGGFINPDDFGKVGEYTSPVESPEYDLFYAGHTSPSVSLCVGLARARDLKKENYNVVAYIGDGALSGGEAFEGMNAAGELKSNLIVIVNDNQMAIAPVAGGIYSGLAELRETNGTAGDNIFRAFGFDYLYVADGNNISDLIDAFGKAKDCPHPIVVHICTQKGEGYVPAERDRETFHYSDPFDVATGYPKEFSSDRDYGGILHDFLMDKGLHDPLSLIVSTATPGVFGLGPDDRKRLGKHYLDPGIAEQTGVAVMAGAARDGVKAIYPVVGTFLQRAYDQLMEDWAMNPSPALMVVCSTGLKGIPDETHLGFWDIPMISSVPDIVYLAPANAEEFKAMLEWGYSQNKYKVAVRMPSYSFEHADYDVDTDYSDIGKFRILHAGSRVALIGAGDFLVKAKEVASLLADKGFDATVVNPRFVSDVDTDMLLELERDHQLVATLEDGSLDGGFAQRVAAAVGSTAMKSLSFGIDKRFRDRYSAETLEKELGLTAPQIADSILSALQC